MRQLIQISEEIKRQQLHTSISRKKKVLSEWASKVDMLKMDLDIIKHEYDVRIGRLLLKDNQLDLEIIHYKNLKTLIEEGLSYEEAIKHEEGKFYQQLLEKQRQEEEIDEEERILQNRNIVSEETAKDIRKLWKKLVFKFHPDLTVSPREKTRREEIMKLINRAYSENDLATLKKIQQEMRIENVKKISLSELEDILVGIENTIIRLQEEYKQLRGSQWFVWKKKKEQTANKDDLFLGFENKLLDDIARKISILQDLRREVNPTYAFLEEK